MEKISAVVIAFNEEQNIEDCLKSVSWADEVILVDSFSTDRTVEIAESLGARVVQNEFKGFGAQKNFAFELAQHEWIVNIDADERVTDELRNEIRHLLETGPKHDGYLIYRRNYIFGQEIRHCGWNHDRILRFIRRDLCRYPDRIIHTEILMENPGSLNGKILHYTYHSFDEYLLKMRRYITGSSRDYYNEGKRAHLHNFIINPAWMFVRMYIFQRGFLDGVMGFILSTVSAFYVFLKYAELYRLQKNDGK